MAGAGSCIHGEDIKQGRGLEVVKFDLVAADETKPTLPRVQAPPVLASTRTIA